jgi:hypothetical protein
MFFEKNDGRKKKSIGCKKKDEEKYFLYKVFFDFVVFLSYRKIVFVILFVTERKKKTNFTSIQFKFCD